MSHPTFHIPLLPYCRTTDFGWWSDLSSHPTSLCPFSLWERVRVRAAFGTFIRAANRPHPRPLSQRERGVFLSLLGWQFNCHPNSWPLTTGHWPLNSISASARRSRAARAARWPTAPTWRVRAPPHQSKWQTDDCCIGNECRSSHQCLRTLWL